MAIHTDPADRPLGPGPEAEAVRPADANPDVSPNERSFEAKSPVLVPAHLFGDWFGVRTAIEDNGITPTITWVSNIAGNPIGGQQQGFTEAENLGMDFLFDMRKLGGIEDTKFHVSMSQRSGTGLSQDYIGNVFPVQQVFGGETFKVVDVDAQRSYADGRLDARLGRIAVTDDFLVSPYFWAFMNNAIDGNPKGIFLNAPGTSAYPSAAWARGCAGGRPIEPT